MAQIFEIDQKKYFTLDEARELLPVIRRITKASHDQIMKLNQKLSYLTDKLRQDEVEAEMQEEFQEWVMKMKRLGCEAKGSWLVDFDSGEGYFCWRYPEEELNHFHNYQEGFGGRITLSV